MAEEVESGENIWLAREEMGSSDMKVKASYISMKKY